MLSRCRICWQQLVPEITNSEIRQRDLRVPRVETLKSLLFQKWISFSASLSTILIILFRISY